MIPPALFLSNTSPSTLNDFGSFKLSCSHFMLFVFSLFLLQCSFNYPDWQSVDVSEVDQSGGWTEQQGLYDVPCLIEVIIHFIIHTWGDPGYWLVGAEKNIYALYTFTTHINRCYEIETLNAMFSSDYVYCAEIHAIASEFAGSFNCVVYHCIWMIIS